MKTVSLPSKRKLDITLAPFADGRELYQVIASELLTLKVSTAEQMNMKKDALCIILSSKRIQAALEPCLGRCLYEGVKITNDCFESVEGREDYIDLCYEVAKENVLPFMKSLYAQFSHLWESKVESPA